MQLHLGLRSASIFRALPTMIEINQPRVGVFRLQLFKASEPFITDQAQALRKFRPIMLGGRQFGDAPSGLEFWTPSGISRHLYPLYSVSSRPDFFQTIIRKSEIRLLHAHFAVDALFAMRTAERADMPFVTTLHGFDVTTRPRDFLRTGRPALMRYALSGQRLHRSGAKFICVSEFMRTAALRAGFPESKSVVHYIGIDPTKFQLSTVDGPPIVLHVARLVEKKGTQYLLEAFADVKKKFDDALLVIIGDGPLRQRLEQIAEAAGILGSVKFLGVQPHSAVRQWMARATVFTLPSVTATNGDAEGLGMVLLEAAACGVPVVATKHGGIPEAVIDGESGYLVGERDSSALAEALKLVLSSESRRHAMGAAGRRLVEERFNVHLQSEKLEAIYQSVL
ncbi:glycosyltransferase [Aquincola tertiaricarbonis]|uniref:Glycosyltransferase n=1 Tax=Aquincola tertiaricarbonis TaxID=391953 RepID=A0ABY4S940_AQUTE|nr:glycosyltransferase [Aquincola tertiaricarbonis]URI09508.1 glycosyltransferase [Aquincola tertiaricarbonis]